MLHQHRGVEHLVVVVARSLSAGISRSQQADQIVFRSFEEQGLKNPFGVEEDDFLGELAVVSPFLGMDQLVFVQQCRSEVSVFVVEVGVEDDRL